MLINEFRSTLRDRTGLPFSDRKSIPRVNFELIMRSAEEKYAINNGYFTPLENASDWLFSLMDISVSIFGGFCGWIDHKGTVYSFGYACHERFRYCFTPDHHEAEQVMAHISPTDGNIEEMMDNISNPRLKTKKMVHSILTFCHSVNHNPYWHEEVLLKLWKEHIDSTQAFSASTPSTEELVTFLHSDEFARQYQNGVPMAHPYGELEATVATTNQHAMHEKALIKPYEDSEMKARFKPSRMMVDSYEAGRHRDSSKMQIDAFRTSLARLGY